MFEWYLNIYQYSHPGYHKHSIPNKKLKTINILWLKFKNSCCYELKIKKCLNYCTVCINYINIYIPLATKQNVKIIDTKNLPFMVYMLLLILDVKYFYIKNKGVFILF